MRYRFDEIAYNSTAKKKPTEDDKETYIGLEHLDSECLTISRWGSEVAPVGEKLIMKKGDILFGKRRAYQRKVGIAPFDGIFSAHGMVLRPNEEVINPNFFPFFICSDQFMERAVRISVGGLSPTINWKDLREQEFDIPSLDEQKELADKLWAAYNLKESYKKLLSATDEMVKSQFIEMFGDPMANSKEWPEYGKINQYAQVILGTTPNSKETSYWDGDIKWITPAEMTDESYYIYDTERHITEEGVKSASLTLLPYRSVLFSTRAPIGKVGLTGSPMYCNQGFKNFICGEKLNPVYLYYSLIYKRDYLISLGTGTTFKELSKKAVEGLNITVPPLHFQDQFESIYDQADKSKFTRLKSQFIEMFSVMPTTPVKTYVDDSFPGEWGTEDTMEAGVKVIRTTNFTNSGKLNLADVVTRSIEDRKIARKQIKKYDTILERSGGTADNPVGRVVLFEEDDLFLCNNFTQVLRFKDIDPRFAFYSLYYFYQTNKTAIRSMGSKTTGIQNLNMSKYLEIGIPNASDEEQKEFVAIAEQADKSKYIN